MQRDAAQQSPSGSSNRWDSGFYDDAFGIITHLGSGVFELLAPQPGERILDLGCGTGHLTARIAEAGAEAVGIDAAEDMVARARALYPNIRIEVARGEDFALDGQFDAVFSSAALHWMSPPDAVAACIARALKPGGRLVAEMGGKRNVVTIVEALYQALAEQGIAREQIHNPWYFPSLGEYAALLERAGLEPRMMHLFERPTPLDDCPDGAADWVRMFADDFLAPVPPDRRDPFMQRVNELTAPSLLHNGRWLADYWRLRFIAIKPDR
jgi:SAM-dependent methyltransferase